MRIVYSRVAHLSLSLPCSWVSHLVVVPNQSLWAGCWWKCQWKATGQICLLQPFRASKLHYINNTENSKKHQAGRSGQVRKLKWKFTEKTFHCVSSSNLCIHCLLCVKKLSPELNAHVFPGFHKTRQLPLDNSKTALSFSSIVLLISVREATWRSSQTSCNNFKNLSWYFSMCRNDLFFLKGFVPLLRLGA